jgi:Phytanoyl-CoA dioxygenase (PhyH)
VISELDVAALQSEGFLVLRRAVDAERLSREVDAALADGYRDAPMSTGSAGNRFRYVPMMCERTPVSLALVDALSVPAAEILGRTVLPVRAKGTRYVGGTAWHRDSELEMVSLGFLAYLDTLQAHSGALRVLPGSHRVALAQPPEGEPDESTAAGLPIETAPGDLIVFDERLWHASSGGLERRQWRVDFVADPVGPDEEATTRGYFEGIFQAGWDGGYDVDRYPSFGEHWRASGRPWVERLRDLGAIERADAEESAVRAKRS